MKHIIAAVAALFTLPVHAACVPVTDGLPGWERLDFDDITPNTWTVEDGALVATANDSASMLYTRLPAGRGPILIGAGAHSSHRERTRRRMAGRAS